MTRSTVKAAAAVPEETEHATVDARSLTRLHALLAAHGINGDKTRHDYLTRALDRPIESANDVTRVEAARLTAELESLDVPEVTTASAKQLRALRAVFPPEAVGKLPRSTCKACRDSQRKRCEEHRWISGCPDCHRSHSSATMHIDYVGHADVTARLLEVDPAWTWRPFTSEEIAALSPALRGAGLWIMLTVLGVTRPGYGDAVGNTGGQDPKVMIGDALRNAAMRFGVALDLWAKGDRDWAHAEKTGSDQQPDESPRQDTPRETYDGPSTAQIIAKLEEHATARGVTLEQLTEKWRTAAGVTMEFLPRVPAPDLLVLERGIAAYLADHPPAPPEQPAETPDPFAAAAAGAEA